MLRTAFHACLTLPWGLYFRFARRLEYESVTLPASYHLGGRIGSTRTEPEQSGSPARTHNPGIAGLNQQQVSRLNTWQMFHGLLTDLVARVLLHINARGSNHQYADRQAFGQFSNTCNSHFCSAPTECLRTPSSLTRTNYYDSNSTNCTTLSVHGYLYRPLEIVTMARRHHPASRVGSSFCKYGLPSLSIGCGVTSSAHSRIALRRPRWTETFAD